MTKLNDKGWTPKTLEAYPHDLGSGVRYSEYVVGEDDTVIGIIEAHLDKDGFLCSGSVPFDVPENHQVGPKWRVATRDPLTLEPSLLCRCCGNHGWIRSGRWEPV